MKNKTHTTIHIIILTLSLLLAACGAPVTTESAESKAFYSGAAAECLIDRAKDFCASRIKMMRDNKFYEQYLSLSATATAAQKP